jgi:hypothetical protein
MNAALDRPGPSSLHRCVGKGTEQRHGWGPQAPEGHRLGRNGKSTKALAVRMRCFALSLAAAANPGRNTPPRSVSPRSRKNDEGHPPQAAEVTQGGRPPRQPDKWDPRCRGPSIRALFDHAEAWPRGWWAQGTFSGSTVQWILDLVRLLPTLMMTRLSLRIRWCSARRSIVTIVREYFGRGFNAGKSALRTNGLAGARAHINCTAKQAELINLPSWTVTVTRGSLRCPNWVPRRAYLHLGSTHQLGPNDLHGCALKSVTHKHDSGTRCCLSGFRRCPTRQ